jgi:hypothetical protein
MGAQAAEGCRPGKRARIVRLQVLWLASPRRSGKRAGTTEVLRAATVKMLTGPQL